MGTSEAVVKKDVYSVWALPPEDVTARVKKLMEGLRSEFGGPQFEPHVTVVGAISLTADDALAKFRSACDGLKAYNATVDRVATGTFFYQCVFLLLHPTSEVVEASAHCTDHFGYKNSTQMIRIMEYGVTKHKDNILSCYKRSTERGRKKTRNTVVQVC
ncbi:cyclic phosphodiesterase-like isoform X2 [Durio zibethinus]|uniref:Cyclic phosphodiesterase-like isoform X2 n=1 Tax=Durio zibethinus TaxID=66656 RepID=A0A6P5WWW2_DURZI|nr:cyclic phosphodiesterase-like isoform X2 [Durio zibethinus]XP_022720353.1 cyclic phosphodiesterase-like isoform X2 [Durio zibethinus]